MKRSDKALSLDRLIDKLTEMRRVLGLGDFPVVIEIDTGRNSPTKVLEVTGVEPESCLIYVETGESFDLGSYYEHRDLNR